MAGMRLGTLVLALLVALAPLPGLAQTPRAATAPLISLFPDDTIAYLETQLRAGAKGAPLDRLLADLLGQPELAAHVGPWGLLPQLARAAAVGVVARGEDVQVVGALLADDPAALARLVLQSQPGAQPSEPYGGATIFATQGRTPVLLAASGPYLLASNSRDGLVAAIDRARAGAVAPPGLAASAGYRAATARLPADRLLTVYLDGPNLAAWLQTYAGVRQQLTLPGGPPALPPTPPLPALTPTMGAAPTALLGAAAALQAGGIALAVSPVPDGLRAVLVQPAASERIAALEPSSGAALSVVPADALFATAGQGLGPRLSEGLEQAGARLEQLSLPGLDLRADLLDWLDGEYAIAATAPEPGSPGLRGFPLPAITLVVETRDPAILDERLRHLASLAGQGGLLRGDPPREERQGDLLIRRLPLVEGLELTWGALGDRWLFLTTGSAGPLARAAATGGLAAMPAYARLARQLPSPNAGSAYLQLGEALRWIESLDGGPLGQVPESERWWRPFAARVGALALATGLPRAGWVEQVGILEIR